jgi:hypothetical protein
MATYVTLFNKKNANAKMVEISFRCIRMKMDITMKKQLVDKSVSQIRGAIKKVIVTVILI